MTNFHSNESIEVPIRNYAIEYGRLGFRVIPLAPDSTKPLVRQWMSAATTNPRVIRDWWRAVPKAAIGLVAGSASGFFVLNAYHIPDAAMLRVLEAEHGSLPMDWVSRGPDFDYNHYFRYPRSYEIPSGRYLFDDTALIFGDGCYVVAPPSHVADEEEPWVQSGSGVGPLPDAPEWLLAEIRRCAYFNLLQKGAPAIRSER